MDSPDVFFALPIEAGEEERSKLEGIADILFCNHSQSPSASFAEASKSSAEFLRSHRLKGASQVVLQTSVPLARFNRCNAETAEDLTDGLSIKLFVRRVHFFHCQQEQTFPQEQTGTEHDQSPTGCLIRKLRGVNTLLPDNSDQLTWQERKGVMHKWRRYVCKAYQCLYASADNEELLAQLRLTLFQLYIECFRAKWKTDKLPETKAMQKVAWIVSWNTFLHGKACDANTSVSPLPDAESHAAFPVVMKWEFIEPLKGSVLPLAEWLKTQTRLIRHD